MIVSWLCVCPLVSGALVQGGGGWEEAVGSWMVVRFEQAYNRGSSV